MRRTYLGALPGNVMRVVSVRGQVPSKWLAEAGHIYVGRRMFIRNGPANGESWPEHPLHNPYRPGIDPDPIDQYRQWAIESPERMAIINDLPDNAVLGCWCINAEENEIMPAGQERCHAEVIVNLKRATV